MTLQRPRARRRYLPLAYRVGLVNAILLVVAVVVTLLVLAPDKFSKVALDEAAVLVGALALVVLANLLLLRRVVGPLAALTALARRVDLSQPRERMPDARATSEAGELALTFNDMLSRLEAERRAATGRVLAGQEAERLRIAQELHDQVGQELTAVLLGLARIHARVDPELRESVGEVQETVRSSLEDVRRIALELRPEALDDLGLVSALAVLCARISERSGIVVEHHVDEHLPHIDPDSELVVYRVAQEALTNVVRHSGSDHASLYLRLAGDQVVLTVSDRGRGLGDGAEPGTGIRGMRERAALIAAELDVGPGEDGRGCRVRLTVNGEDRQAGR